MQGTGAARFGAEEPLSREQLWTVMMRVSGKDPENREELFDWLAETNLSDGASPESTADRQQTVTLLWRLAKLNGWSTAAGGLSGWQDAEKAAPWAEDALAWAADAGIIKGVEPGRLCPDGAVSRAQFVVLLQRFCQYATEQG